MAKQNGGSGKASGGDDKARIAGKGSDQRPKEGTPGQTGAGGTGRTSPR